MESEESNKLSHSGFLNAAGYVVLSLLGAYVTFDLLSSTGTFSGKGFTFGGAATVFLATLVLLLRHDKVKSRISTKFVQDVVPQITSEKQYCEDYIAHIVTRISDANSSVKLHFPMLRTSDKGDVPRNVNDAIRLAAQRVPVTIITCAEYDRIAAGHELSKTANVKIMFSNELKSSDLRFTLIDGDDAIIGINPRQNESIKYHPSTEWVCLRSLRLAKILDNYFSELESRALPYEKFAKEQVFKYAEGKMDNHKLAARSLYLPEQEVCRLLR